MKPYRFPYPTALLPVPYHTDTTLHALSSYLIPLTRSSRPIIVEVPSLAPSDSSAMDTDGDGTSRMLSLAVDVMPDGMLLYVSEASYESGTSPLSSWIPIKNPITNAHTTAVKLEGPLDKFTR